MTDTRAYVGRDPEVDSQRFIIAEGRCWAEAQSAGRWLSATEAVEAQR